MLFLRVLIEFSAMNEERREGIQKLVHLCQESADSPDLINILGKLIDRCSDKKDLEGLNQALQRISKVQFGALSPGDHCTLLYFQANAWAAIHRCRAQGNVLPVGAERPELAKSVSALRQAMRHDGFSDLIPFRRCQILTNLGIDFERMGRRVESIQFFDQALDIDPDFPMARGCRGDALVHYGYALRCEPETYALICLGYRDLKVAAGFGDTVERIKQFRESVSYLEKNLSPAILAGPPHMHDCRIGKSAPETNYRMWCLQHRLFLNPLNDAISQPPACCDTLSMPAIGVRLDEGPHYPGFFNQIVQEYVSARFMLYEGLIRKRPHYSDRGVPLTNTLDYPLYGLGREKRRAAYRIAYSLLDKIAYLIREYYELPLGPKQTYFRSVWFKDQRRQGKKAPPVSHEEFAQAPWPIQGLYWLSRDLHSDEKEYADSLEPDARMLHDIRNHLEHKYLKVHADWWIPPAAAEADLMPLGVDRLSF